MADESDGENVGNNSESATSQPQPQTSTSTLTTSPITSSNNNHQSANMDFFVRGSKVIKLISSLPDPTVDLVILGQIAGTVRSGRMLDGSNRVVAVKMLEFKDGDLDEEEHIAAEINVMRTCQHKNIVQMVSVYCMPQVSRDVSGRILSTHAVLLVLDLCSRGSMGAFARRIADRDQTTESSSHVPLSENAIAFVVQGVLLALTFLHRKSIAHRDIKGSNILVTEDGNIKLGDLGSAVFLPAGVGHAITSFGTTHWMSPEACAAQYKGGYAYDLRCDVWSLGITVIEIATGRPPHWELSSNNAIQAILSSGPPPSPPNASQNMAAFVASALVKDYEQRPASIDLLHHAFLHQIDENSARTELQQNPHLPIYTLDMNSSISDSLAHRNTDNLAALPQLTEPLILNVLRQRFQAGLPYTAVGEILVAINPLKPLPLYTKDVQSRYEENASAESRPHIYHIAAIAHRALILSQKNQSIVISGESGAGKTESTKHLINHLLHLAAMTSPQAVTSTHTHDRLLFAMHTLVEAFGNASTQANRNSSRFGKYIEVLYDARFQVIGARLSDYLLEKSRVSVQIDNDCNYHVFYRLLAGASAEHIAPLSLTRIAEDYAYLNGGITPLQVKDKAAQRRKSSHPEIDTTTTTTTTNNTTTTTTTANTSATWLSLEHGMHSLGFLETEIGDIRATLAIVLHLGNVDFLNIDDALHLQCSGPVAVIAKLLGVDESDFSNTLTTSLIIARGETIVMRNTIEAARAARDAMAKMMYGRLFSWLGNRVTALVAPIKHAPTYSIGVLDIFGFENMLLNSLEQLHINIANEQLQVLFNTHVFDWLATELGDDGVAVPQGGLASHSSSGVLNILMQTPLGVLSLIDEETRFPGATETTLCHKLRDHLSSIDVRVSDERKKLFTVAHYAGSITYTLTGWLDKNRDYLSPGATGLLRESSCALICDLFSTSNTSTGGLSTTEAQSLKASRQDNARQLIDALRGTVWNNKDDLPIAGETPPPPSLPLSKSSKKLVSTACGFFSCVTRRTDNNADKFKSSFCALHSTKHAIEKRFIR